MGGVVASLRACLGRVREVPAYDGDERMTMDAPLTATVPTMDDLRAHRAAILEIAGRHGAVNLAVFGSVARGDAIATSDYDVIVDMVGTYDPWGYFGHLNDLRTELEALLGRRVDVVDRRGLRRNREVILAESVPL